MTGPSMLERAARSLAETDINGWDGEAWSDKDEWVAKNWPFYMERAISVIYAALDLTQAESELVALHVVLSAKDVRAVAWALRADALVG